MPEYSKWSEAVQRTIEDKEIDILECLIVAFLWIGTTGSEDARRDFATLCIKKITELSG